MFIKKESLHIQCICLTPGNENDTRGNYRFTASQRPRKGRKTNGDIAKNINKVVNSYTTNMGETFNMEIHQ